MIEQVCGILEANAFEVMGTDGTEGRAVFPLVAMANSSCLPNLTHIISKEKIVLVASRDIGKGEQMLLCYTGTR